MQLSNVHRKDISEVSEDLASDHWVLVDADPQRGPRYRLTFECRF